VEEVEGMRWPVSAEFGGKSYRLEKLTDSAVRIRGRAALILDGAGAAVSCGIVRRLAVGIGPGTECPIVIWGEVEIVGEGRRWLPILRKRSPMPAAILPEDYHPEVETA
jgi:hypothetical protein